MDMNLKTLSDFKGALMPTTKCKDPHAATLVQGLASANMLVIMDCDQRKGLQPLHSLPVVILQRNQEAVLHRRYS